MSLLIIDLLGNTALCVCSLKHRAAAPHACFSAKCQGRVIFLLRCSFETVFEGNLSHFVSRPSVRAPVELSGVSLPSGIAFPPGYHFGALRFFFSPLGIPFVPQELPRHVFWGAIPSGPTPPLRPPLLRPQPAPKMAAACAPPRDRARPPFPACPAPTPDPGSAAGAAGPARRVPLPPWESRPSSAGSAASTPPSSSTASRRR